MTRNEALKMSYEGKCELIARRMNIRKAALYTYKAEDIKSFYDENAMKNSSLMESMLNDKE